jgi:integrase
MATIKLKHVNSFYDRHGKLRHLIRVPGQKAKTLPGAPGSEKFMAAYHAAMSLAGGIEIGASRSQPGTFTTLIAEYYQSKIFTEGFAVATQQMRRAILERWREAHGDKRVAHLRSQDVRRFLEQQKPYAQKNWLKTLRGVMLFAVAQNYRADDPTRDVRAIRVKKSLGQLGWDEPQIAAYRATHPLGTMARSAIELVLNTAARRGDAWQLGPQHIKDGKLCWRPNKTKRSTGKMLAIKMLPECQAALDAMPPANSSMAFLVNDYGRPFASAAAFGNKFADWCRQAGLKPVMCDDGKVRNYRVHGLRKTSLMALVRARCDILEIMAVSGHSSLAQVQVYIDEFNREQKADAAIEKLIATRK